MEINLSEARILIVDDEPANVRLIERILKDAGYRHYHGTTDPRDALARYQEVQPDLIILDLVMPDMGGFTLIEQLGRKAPQVGGYIPLLIVTADFTPAAKRQALAMGAVDVIAKPFDSIEMVLRIRNLLHLRFLYRVVHDHNQHLTSQVRQQTQQIDAAYLEILERLARAGEYRDTEGRHHTQRVGQLAAHLARQLGRSEAEIAMIRHAAPLHDIGNVGISDQILLKSSALTPAEVELMKTHTLIGAKILQNSPLPVVQMAESIALSHHEAWDGSGYPQGLRGEVIPLWARLAAVADTFDSMTHLRPYLPAVSIERAVAEIRAHSGRRFDPAVVDAFELIIQPHLARQ